MGAERVVVSEIDAADLRLLVAAVREQPGSPSETAAVRVERALNESREAA